MQVDRGVLRLSSEKFGRPIKAMLVPDVHLRDRDFSTVKNSSVVSEKVFLHIMQLARKMEIDVLILMGDLTDCGYRNDHILLHHHTMFKREFDSFLVSAGIFGNHMFIEKDSNLEYFIFQPHAQLTGNPRFKNNKPVLKNPSAILIDNLQFSLFNYDRVNKDYTYPRLQGCEYNVGLYHDDSVLPSEVSRDFHITTNVTSAYLQSTYENVDEAVLAHIHKPYPPTTLMVDGKEVVIYLPGSCTITENSDAEKHSFVDLHVYEVFENKFKHTIAKAPTYIDELEFIISRSKEKQMREDFSSKDGDSIIKTDDVSVMEYTSSAHRTNLYDFMRGRGYTEQSLEILKLTSSLTLDFDTAYDKFVEANNKPLLDGDIDG